MAAAKTTKRAPRKTGTTRATRAPRTTHTAPAAKPKKRTARVRRPRAPDAVDRAQADAPARALSGKAARYLRGLGHHLDAVVQIGKEGITHGLVDATREALLAHELVKVRILAEAPVDRHVAGAELAAQAGALLAQTLGRTLLLYKRHPHKPRIVLPR